MRGLFLQGGGAKGAFQAGAVYAFYEKGINFKVISGTSIGAINGYYIYTGNIEEMKNLYINENKIKVPEYLHKVVENDYVINEMKKLQVKRESIKSFYVNYTEVNKGELKEKIVDVDKLDREKAVNCVKYSSLLPYIGPSKINDFNDLVKNFDSKEVFEKFKDLVVNGEYDGYNLDGGILNNNLLSPFMEENLDKIYLLPLSNSFEVPDYLYNKYNDENIVVVKRNKAFRPEDTLNFNIDFLRNLFYEGYYEGKKCIH
ncbi:patatin-like phospholipase [Clostridium acetireducens DSM 10703]|uniref:Patatin-like phospholipase n=1 Tax=Clostridium acetireducens DSM 10703 TaxID=1121290 RepID=A0A1E8EWI6_9CLOT|nr:patatin-like phospholipase family protein [Clostridium acetireducens]OFI04999.1 patatin-like phospholipase [Clostridium acetireducens DSM 10703]